MISFLNHVANDLYDKVNGDFTDVIMVFPNKRASLFFNRFLWEKSDGKTMFTPEYTTISALFERLSDYSIADPIYLVCKLYEVYIRHDVNCEKTFDELYPLLEMILRDFEDVDSNMVPADRLFGNLKELHDFDDLEYLEPEQRKAIMDFFGAAHWLEDTKEKNRFMSLWNLLYDIYTDFRKELADNGDEMVYEGMLKRAVVEPVTGRDKEISANADKLAEKLPDRKFVFVGFNVLNRCEHELFSFCKRNRQSYFYWDYDVSYCPVAFSDKLKNQHGFEAGMFIKENIRDFGSAFEKDSEAYREMSKPKSVTFIKSSSEDAQARYTHEWVENTIKEGDRLVESAVVLCNEDILMPTLHAVPPECAIGKTILNVTMGYPLILTPIYNLIQLLIELQLQGKSKTNTWRYRYVSDVLKHPYIEQISKGTSANTLLKLTSDNVIFPKFSFFDDDPILSKVFCCVRPHEFLPYLSELTEMVAQSIAIDEQNNDFDIQLYKQSVFETHTALNRLSNMKEKMPVMSALSEHTLARLITHLLRGISIPFHGEPAEGLQVMGFLETRNLDFKNVLLLSAAEGQMPRDNKRPSLIPYTLQKAFGMTTIEKQTSIYAYYFYRLLQRAENVTIMWNSSANEGTNGEMSRFMLQLLVEKENIFAPGQEIDLKTLLPESEMAKPYILSMKNDENIQERLHNRFDIATEEDEEWKKHHPDNYKLMLSPSAINTFQKCKLQFFFRYIARILPDNEVSEDMDDAVFGNVFHYAMEQVYRPVVGRPIMSSWIRSVANDKKLIKSLVDQGFAIKLFNLAAEDNIECVDLNRLSFSGSQLIKHHVLQTLIKAQLMADADEAESYEEQGGGLKILAIEEELNIITTIKPHVDKDAFRIRLGGIIDRIDMVDNGHTKTIRVVDYKTSNNEQMITYIRDLFNKDKSLHNYHILQTLYYCKVLSEKKAHGAGEYPVVPVVMYYKNNIARKSSVVKVCDPSYDGKKPKRVPILSYDEYCRDEFEPLLKNLIESIFTTDSYDPCEKEDACLYCDFKRLCMRNPSPKNFD